MDLKQVISSEFPVLYHVTDQRNLPSILKYGLRSTTGLLDLFGKTGQERDRLARQRRKTASVLEDPIIGSVRLNDQEPLVEGKLVQCLKDGMDVEDWCFLLNQRIFFWPTTQRLQTYLNAYRNKPQRSVISVQTEALLDVYWDQIEVSAINSGAVVHNPKPRGADTFVAITEYPFKFSKTGRVQNVFAELTVRSSEVELSKVGARILDTDV